MLGIFQKDTRGFLDGLNEVILKNNAAVKGSYPGYVDPFLEDAQKQYWGGNLARLESIKKVRDPGRFFGIRRA